MRYLLSSLAILSTIAALPALAAPQLGKTYDDWAVECERTPAGGNSCFLSQTQLLKENKARLLKASIGYLGPKQQPMLVLVLPLGVDLRAGIAIKVDDAPQLSLPYQQCLQDGCTGALSLDDTTLSALRKSKRIQIGMLPYGSKQTVTINMSPSGLARGMDALR